MVEGEYIIIKHKEKGYLNVSNDKLHFSSKIDTATKFLHSVFAEECLTEICKENKKYKAQDFFVSTVSSFKRK